MRRGIRRLVLGAGAVAAGSFAAALLGGGPASAAPAPSGPVVGTAPPGLLADAAHGIDPAVPRNGVWPRIGYLPSLVPPDSPLQIPTPVVTHDRAGTTDVRVFPYLPPWLHNGIVSRFPPDTAFEIAGAIHLAVPGTSGRVEINPNGHCLFVGGGRSQQYLPRGFRRTVESPVRAEVPLPGDGGFTVTIDPRVFRRG
ncbi:hypothetical protein [Tsukamurella soli]|uniref:Uncharacterized protein n=1 Tax=Tsukamurella soli TaxID=644556 RepID=A0ABP8J296_9ACTN